MSNLLNKKYIWALPVLIILLFFLFKPGSNNENIKTLKSTNEQVKTIRIATPDMSSGQNSSSGSVLVDYIYVNKLLEKEFEKDNIKIEWNFFKGAGPAINEALVNRQLDFAFLGDFAAIIGKANQIDTRLLLATGRKGHGYLAVQPNQGYKDLASLRGKRIAVWHGTAAQLSFNQVLDYYGYTEKDFRVLNLDFAAMNAAMVAKQIDAAWGALPMLALQQKGLVDVPISSADTKSSLGTTQGAFIGRSEFIQHHPEVVQRIINTILKASYHVSLPENKDEVIRLVANNANYPEQLYRLGLRNMTLNEVYSPLLDDYYVNHFKIGIKSALQVQLIKSGFDVDQWVDDHFLNKGLEQLGYQNIWVAQNK
ncbi:ABC transporter substrate-binding protein [Acinetobacter populi]|uniref:Sulfate ester-binding protein n=1 Tax=Acinetobacter populi TaxID=1582270 RepID=A0A1Z9Z065_9GAMM|nr:ABC transporter substrate-binding protein [Acinetobacter populi]OUY07863.1 sulfate ester-binding protein [Acinetobacter populi]